MTNITQNHFENLALESYAITNLGRIRKNNEDNFLIGNRFIIENQFEQAGSESIELDGGTLGIHSGVHLFAVCDGMGGEECGEVASRIAVQEFANLFTQKFNSDTIIAEIENALHRANERVFAQARERGLRRIGSTAALACIGDGKLYAFNVGDSRIYLSRAGALAKLSREHTELRYAVEAGFISEEEARTHPLRHRLTQNLGMDPEEMRMTPYHVEAGPVQPGDAVLLCSDGLTDMVDDDGIQRLLSTNQPSRDIARALVQMALKAGGEDNVTVVVVKALSV